MGLFSGITDTLNNAINQREETKRVRLEQRAIKSHNRNYGTSTNMHDVAVAGWKSNEGFFTNFGEGLGGMLNMGGNMGNMFGGGSGGTISGGGSINASGSNQKLIILAVLGLGLFFMLKK